MEFNQIFHFDADDTGRNWNISVFQYEKYLNNNPLHSSILQILKYYTGEIFQYINTLHEKNKYLDRNWFIEIFKKKNVDTAWHEKEKMILKKWEKIMIYFTLRNWENI